MVGPARHRPTAAVHGACRHCGRDHGVVNRKIYAQPSRTQSTGNEAYRLVGLCRFIGEALSFV